MFNLFSGYQVSSGGSGGGGLWSWAQPRVQQTYLPQGIDFTNLGITYDYYRLTSRELWYYVTPYAKSMRSKQSNF